MKKSFMFNTVQLKGPKRNSFDLTHGVTMSGKAGDLMPCLAMEVVPGDKVDLSCETLTRVAPMLAPVYGRMKVFCHYWFVPNRVVWPEEGANAGWVNFIANNPTGGIPTITIDGTETADQQRLLDYLGIPPFVPGGDPQTVNALPMAGFQMIYNEWYRDQNLIAEVDYKLVDGSNAVNKTTLITPRRRAYSHDYFTSCLPTAQKGADAAIPIGDITLDPDWALGATDPNFKDAAGNIVTGDILQDVNVQIHPPVGPFTAPVAYDPEGSLVVTSTTINDLRTAFRLQEWLERLMRAGSRYAEVILAHFGVKSKDARLQRPEYITGMAAPVVISEVLNTTGDTGAVDPLPQGNMSGKGVAVGDGHLGSFFVEEHGYIIGIVSVMPIQSYMQGIPRTFLRRTPTDYYWPSFAHLGEQEVTKAELYAYDSASPELFGYQARYAEYRYMPDRVAGDFRTSLRQWTLTREFAAAPELNEEFIEVEPEDIEHIFAVQDGTDTFWIHHVNQIRALRPMPVFGTPML